MLEIKFKNRKYLLIGDLQNGGAIATEKAYTTGLVSYASLSPKGIIRRFHEVIGTRDDIEILGESDAKPKPIAYLNFTREIGKTLLGLERKKRRKKNAR